MPILKIVFVFVCLFPTTSFAASINLFKLHRVNYKAYKQLRYDLNYNQNTCEINTQKPLNVFYENVATKEALSEFSSNSRKYFAPKVSRISKNQMNFSFKALDEMKQQLGSSAKLTVYLDNNNGKCEVTTELAFGNTAFDLRKINVSVTTTLGLPTGVEWVLLEGVRNGSYFSHKISN